MRPLRREAISIRGPAQAFRLAGQLRLLAGLGMVAPDRGDDIAEIGGALPRQQAGPLRRAAGQGCERPGPGAGDGPDSDAGAGPAGSGGSTRAGAESGDAREQGVEQGVGAGILEAMGAGGEDWRVLRRHRELPAVPQPGFAHLAQGVLGPGLVELVQGHESRRSRACRSSRAGWEPRIPGSSRTRTDRRARRPRCRSGRCRRFPGAPDRSRPPGADPASPGPRRWWRHGRGGWPWIWKNTRFRTEGGVDAQPVPEQGRRCVGGNGSTQRTATRLSGKVDRKRSSNSSSRELLPAPPVPVTPTTGQDAGAGGGAGGRRFRR